MLKDVFLIPVENTYFVCKHPISSAEFDLYFLRNKAGPSVPTDVPGEQGCGFGLMLSAGCACTEAYGSGAGLVSALLIRLSFTSAAHRVQVPSLQCLEAPRGHGASGCSSTELAVAELSDFLLLAPPGWRL